VRHCTANTIPLFVIGRGSNLLISDGGIEGAVVHLARGEFRNITVNGTEITAGAGVKLKELSYAARDALIAGFEWFEGIPGQVGGALRMNAGAMGGETFRQVTSVRYVDAQGVFHTVVPSDMQVHYRDVPSLARNYAVAATFKGAPGKAEEIHALLDASMQKRRLTQPKESSAGCIFKNPPSCPAGKLVDELGLKDTRVGGARVSTIHGNFIVNDGNATAADVLELIAKIKAIALEKRGIELETEVQILGVQ
jgi:UDP-N-acetylenolpyruvoylglucosamine reductase